MKKKANLNSNIFTDKTNNNPNSENNQSFNNNHTGNSKLNDFDHTSNKSSISCGKFQKNSISFYSLCKV